MFPICFNLQKGRRIKADKAMSNQLWVSPVLGQGLFVGCVWNGELTFTEYSGLSKSFQMAFESPSFSKHSFLSSRE